MIVATIVNYAVMENLDLIIVGTRGLEGLKKLMLGGVSSGVVDNDLSQVLVIRQDQLWS